jgi:hypothetical protein
MGAGYFPERTPAQNWLFPIGNNPGTGGFAFLSPTTSLILNSLSPTNIFISFGTWRQRKRRGGTIDKSPMISLTPWSQAFAADLSVPGERRGMSAKPASKLGASEDGP